MNLVWTERTMGCEKITALFMLSAGATQSMGILEYMNYHKGFTTTTILLVVLGILVLGGLGYVVLNPQVLQAPTAEVADDGVQTAPGDHPEEDRSATDGVPTNDKISIAWRFSSAGEIKAIPHTKVAVVINGMAHEVGTFAGSCSEIGATGGVDGKGLLAGELSATQCWFAGGGNEIGVFAHEDGGVEIMVGELGEGEEGAGVFRGNFSIKSTIRF